MPDAAHRPLAKRSQARVGSAGGSTRPEYTSGDVSYLQIGERHGLAEGHVRAILSNRLYDGWSVRHRRSADQILVAAPWHDDPPVSDELWSRVEEARARRVKTAGRTHPRRVHLLARRLW